MRDDRIGKKIKFYREKAGISQDKLAEMLDLSVASVSNLERGINYPTMENFINLANELKTSADALLIDVIDYANPPQFNELSQLLENASPEKRRQALQILEIILK